MVARWFPVGLLLVLSVSATLGLSTAQAAYPAGSAFTVQHRSPQFRPLSRADVGANAVQRQSRVLSPTRGGDHRRQQPVFSDDRAGARKAVPITRGQELGLRFRPDERASPYGQSVMPHDGGAADRYSEQLHSQFRPAPRRRKPTYEELQAEDAAQPQLMPGMPYPMLPQPPPGYPGGLPRW